MRRKRILWFAVRAIPIFILAAALFGFFVKALWNWLVPPIFGWQAIGYWQAIGLLVLSKILFGGFRGGRGWGGPGRFGPGGRMAWRQRWESMSEEERERFRAGMGSRCGPFGPPPDEEPGNASA